MSVTQSDEEKRQRSVQLFLSVHAMRRGVMSSYTEAHLTRTTNLDRYTTNGLEAEDAAFNRANMNGGVNNTAGVMMGRGRSQQRAAVGGVFGSPASVFDRFEAGDVIEVDDEDEPNENEKDKSTSSGADSDAIFDDTFDEIEAEVENIEAKKREANRYKSLFTPKSAPQESALSRRALLLGLRTPPPIASDNEQHQHYHNGALNKYVDSEASFIDSFGKLWDEGKVMRMRRRLFEVAEDFFDPTRPQAMMNFVALGGLDMFCRLLCLNPTWASQEAQGVVTGARRLVAANSSRIFGMTTGRAGAGTTTMVGRSNHGTSASTPSLPSRVMAEMSNTGAGGKPMTLETLRKPYLMEGDEFVSAFLTTDSTLSTLDSMGIATPTGADNEADNSNNNDDSAVKTVGGAFGLGPAIAPKSLGMRSNASADDAAMVGVAAKYAAEADDALTLDEEAAVDPFGHCPPISFPSAHDLGANTMQQNALVANTTIIATIVRIVTEAVVCSSHMGWYLYDWRRGALIRRLLALSAIPSLREGTFILVEHLLSIVGPAVHLGSIPEFTNLVKEAVKGTVYALTAVRQVPTVASAIEKLKEEYANAKRQQRLQEKFAGKFDGEDGEEGSSSSQAKTAKAKDALLQSKVRHQNALANLRTAIQELLETNNSATILPLPLQSYLLHQEQLLAAASRVMSLSVVAGVMSDDRSNNYYFDDGSVNSGAQRRMEPFPQCLSRIEAMDNVVSENVDFLLHIPKFVPSLLRLIDKKDEKSAMRIFRGNRTMTVVADDNGNISLPSVGGATIQTATAQTRVLTGAEAAAAAAAAAGGQTITIAPNVQVSIVNANAGGAAAAPAAAPQQPAQQQRQMQAMLDQFDDDFDEEYEEDEWDDEFDGGADGGGGGGEAALTNQLMAALGGGGGGQGVGGGAANADALQQFVNMLMAGAAGGGAQMDVNGLTQVLQQLQQMGVGGQQQQQQPAAASPQQQQQQAAAPQQPAADPQELLRQAAQGVGNEMPDANAMDSIDLDWFVGNNMNSQSRWRLGNMVLRGDGPYTPSHNVRPFIHGNAVVGARRAAKLFASYGNGGVISVPPEASTSDLFNNSSNNKTSQQKHNIERIASLIDQAFYYAKEEGLSGGVWDDCDALMIALRRHLLEQLASESHLPKEAQLAVTNYKFNNGSADNESHSPQSLALLRSRHSAKFALSLSLVDSVFEDMHWYFEARDKDSVKRRNEAFIAVMEEAEFVARNQTTFHASEAQDAIRRGTVRGMTEQTHNNTVRQYTRKQRYDHQQIIGCQSEIYFVASSLLMTQNYTLAHGILTASNVVPILNKMFGYVFYTEAASNCIHYGNTTQPMNSNNVNSNNTAANNANNAASSPTKGGKGDPNASPNKASPHDDDDDESRLGAIGSNASPLAAAVTAAAAADFNQNDNDDDSDDERGGQAAGPTVLEKDDDLVEVQRVVKLDNGILFEAPKNKKKDEEDDKKKKKQDDVDDDADSRKLEADLKKTKAALSVIQSCEPEMFYEEIVTRHPMTALKSVMVKRSSTKAAAAASKKPHHHHIASATSSVGDTPTSVDAPSLAVVAAAAAVANVGTTTTPPSVSAASTPTDPINKTNNTDDVLVADNDDALVSEASDTDVEEEENFVFNTDADEFDDEDDSHQHDPDTLRKLELVRVLHEYFNAQDRVEVTRILHNAENAVGGQSISTVTSASSPPATIDDAISENDTMALKIAERIVASVEDPCVETTALHALEAYIRVTCFENLQHNALAGDGNGFDNDKDKNSSSSSSSSSSNHLVLANAPSRFTQTRLLGLLRHLVEERIWGARHDRIKNKKTPAAASANATDATAAPATGGGAENPVLANSMYPSKRTDAVMAALGEIVKYHPRNIFILNEYLKLKAGENINISEADYKYVMKKFSSSDASRETEVNFDLPSSVPLNFNIQLPSPAEEGRYARRQGDTLGSLLRRRMVSYSSECNLFLRLIAVSMMTGITYPGNYARKCYDTFSLVPSSAVTASASAIVSDTDSSYTIDGPADMSPSYIAEHAFHQGQPRLIITAGDCSSNGREKKVSVSQTQFLEPFEDMLKSIAGNEKRVLEASGLLLSRLYFVRQVGRQFVAQLLAHLHLNIHANRSIEQKKNAAAGGPTSPAETALARAQMLFSGVEGADYEADKQSASLNPINWVAEYLSWISVHSPTTFDRNGYKIPVVGFGGFAPEVLRVTAVPELLPENEDEQQQQHTFNTDRPFSLLDDDSLEYPFGFAIRPARLKSTATAGKGDASTDNSTFNKKQQLSAYINVVRSKIFPSIAHLPTIDDSLTHAQQRRTAVLLAPSAATTPTPYLYHLPPSYFLAKPERCVYPVVFEEDYAFVQQMPIAATLHPLVRGGAAGSANTATGEGCFASFRFPRAPIAGVHQHKDNPHVKKFASTLDKAFLHNVAHSGWIVENCKQISQDLLSDPAILIYSLLKSSAIRPDNMENTEKLCLITSSLILFLREHWLDPENGVENILIRLRQISRASKVKAEMKRLESQRKLKEQYAAIKKQREEGATNPEQAVTPSTILAAAGAFTSELQQRATITSYQNPFLKQKKEAASDDDDEEIENDDASEEKKTNNTAVSGDEVVAAIDNKTIKKKPARFAQPTLTNNDVALHEACTKDGEDMVISNGTDSNDTMSGCDADEDDTWDGSTEQTAAVTSAGELIYSIREFGATGMVSGTNSFQRHHQHSDFFVSFFRILSVWISHYCSSQRYMETIFVCSHVPFGEWKVCALDVFRRLPFYFDDVQKYVME